MSYSHTRRRKMIMRFKKGFGDKRWYKLFRERVDVIVKGRQRVFAGAVKHLENCVQTALEVKGEVLP